MYRCKLVVLNKPISILWLSSQGGFPNDLWDRYGKSGAILTTSGFRMIATITTEKIPDRAWVKRRTAFWDMYWEKNHVLNRRELWPRFRLQVWKNGGYFVDHGNKMLGTWCAFPIFPVTSNIFSSRHFSAKTQFFHKPSLHTAPYKLHSKQGKPCFLNSYVISKNFVVDELFV